MARTLTQTEFEHMLIALKKEAFDARRFREMTLNVEGSFQAFLENLGDFAYELNGRGIVCYANQAAEHVIGRPLNMIVGKAFLSLLKADCRTDGLDMLNRTLRGESTVCELTFSNGNTCHFKSEPMWDAYHKICGICGIARDVSEMKTAKQALLQANEDLRQRLDQVTRDLLAANRKLEERAQHTTRKRKSACPSVINNASGERVEGEALRRAKQALDKDEKGNDSVLPVDDEDNVTIVSKAAL